MTHFSWKRTLVDGRPAQYGVIGAGRPVLFLHGWALAHHAYRDTLRPLADLGCRVFAPALPGFGGTRDLRGHHVDFAGFGAWTREFCATVGINEPAIVIGHSFGGGVAIQLAADAPALVDSVVLLNSIGGRWDQSHLMAERPLWRWGLALPTDVLGFVGGKAKVVPSLLEDAIPNLMRNPLAVYRVGTLARHADLGPQLRELRHRSIPVTVVHGDADAIVPRSSFDALCAVLGVSGTVVRGSHSWPLADAEGFTRLVRPLVTAPRLPRSSVA